LDKNITSPKKSVLDKNIIWPKKTFLAKNLWPKTPFPEKKFGRKWTRSHFC